MLSGETAGGEHPTAAVTIMSQTCCESEGAQNTNMLYQAVRNSTLAQYHTLSTSESIASSAVKTTIDCGAKAIVVVSESGTTATQVAKFRPGRKFSYRRPYSSLTVCENRCSHKLHSSTAGPIIVLTTNEQVARQCCGVLRSASAMVLESFSKMDDSIEALIADLKKDGLANPGDAIVVVTGTINQKGATNLMRVQYA